MALAWKLVETKPTTISALILLVTYVVELEENQCHGWNEPENRRVTWSGEFHKAILDGLLRLPVRTGLDTKEELDDVLRLLAKPGA